MLKEEPVFVTGLTGNVGWGIARALLRVGAPVVGLVRREEDAEGLKRSFSELGDFRSVVGDLATSDGARKLVAALAGGGGIGHAVLSLGGWWQGGPLRQQNAEDFAPVRAGLLDTQMNAATTLLPFISQAEDPSYTIITGAGALSPIPDAGFTVIAAAAVRAVSMMLRFEEANGPVRVNEVLIRTRVERIPRPGVHSADKFGDFVTELLASDLRGAVLDYPPPPSGS